MITLEQAQQMYINFISTERNRLQKLFDYYNGNHDILKKENRENGKTAKIINNYAKYISTLANGYFIGVPISYNSKEDISELSNIYKLNFESSHNAELALNMSIFGKAYELNYLDENSQYNIACLDARTVITVTDGTIKNNITDAIVISQREIAGQDKTEITLAVYDSTNCKEYKAIVDAGVSASEATFTEGEERQHNMGRCPIIEYKNNLFSKGDFEDVVTLIDAYNDATSTSIEDLTDFTDAYLKLIGYNDLDNDDLKSIKDNKVLLLDEKGDADWLVKNVNDTYSENIKNRLKHDIHKFSFTPDLTDEAFAGNITGIAIKCKFQALEQLRQEKERTFTKALMQRMSMINTFLGKYGKNLNVLSINIIFSANMPINTAELVNSIVSLGGTVSKKTQLAQLPFVKNVDDEMELLAQEKDSYYNQESLEFN